MKLSGDRFSIPNCILDDGLPDKAFRLLVFLFSVSDMAGCAAATYDEMKQGADITSRSTVSDSLKLLRKHGWFHFVKKGGGKKAVYWLRLPPRYTETDKPNAKLAIRMFPRSAVQ
jgi:hypothetical protein